MSQQEKKDAYGAEVVVKTPAQVTLQLKNDVDPTWPSVVTEVEVTSGSSVYDMLQVAAANGTITFKARWNPNFQSHLIYSINGLEEDDQNDTYWRFEDGDGNPFDKGVDLVFVYNGDTIQFIFVKS